MNGKALVGMYIKNHQSNLKAKKVPSTQKRGKDKKGKKHSKVNKKHKSDKDRKSSKVTKTKTEKGGRGKTAALKKSSRGTAEL